MNYTTQNKTFKDNRILIICCSALLCCFMGINGHAASVSEQAEGKAALAMNSASFDAWLIEQKKLLDKERNLMRTEGKKDRIIKPEALEIAFFERLESGKQITDDAIQTLVSAWIDYDNLYTVREENKGLRYAESLRVIRKLILSFPERNLVQAMLYNREGQLLREAGDNVNANKSFEKAQGLLTPIRFEYDRLGNQVTLDLAYSFEILGEKKKAASLYFEVFRYPLYRVSESVEYSQVFMDQYINAARGLIRVRRYQLDDLKHIHLYGFVRDTVGKELEAAITEAS